MDLVIPSHSSSSSQREEEEVVVEVRNWLELPKDVMCLIFLKLSTMDILFRAQRVCTTWWKLSKEPQLYRSIDLRNPCGSLSQLKEMLGIAVKRSCGQLEEFSVGSFASKELLPYISQTSSSLRCLRLVSCFSKADDGLIEMAKKFPLLEELEISNCSFSKGVFEKVFCSFPQLKSFRLNYVTYWGKRTLVLDEVAVSIAENMHELRHLNLFGDKMTDDGLRAILDGCPQLKSLDLRRCFNLNFAGDLKERCINIKLRFPMDPTNDFEYVIDPVFMREDYGGNVYMDSDDDEYYGVDPNVDDTDDSDDEEYYGDGFNIDDIDEEDYGVDSNIDGTDDSDEEEYGDDINRDDNEDSDDEEDYGVDHNIGDTDDYEDEEDFGIDINIDDKGHCDDEEACGVDHNIDDNDDSDNVEDYGVDINIDDKDHSDDEEACGVDHNIDDNDDSGNVEDYGVDVNIDDNDAYDDEVNYGVDSNIDDNNDYDDEDDYGVDSNIDDNDDSDY